MPLLTTNTKLPPMRTAIETGLPPPEEYGRVHHVGQVARVVVDLEAGNLVVLRAQQPT